MTLLQHKCLGIENKALLTEMHHQDECRHFGNQLYSNLQCMQNQAPLRVGGESSDEE
jgi:hypothetical protein